MELDGFFNHNLVAKDLKDTKQEEYCYNKCPFVVRLVITSIRVAKFLDINLEEQFLEEHNMAHLEDFLKALIKLCMD